MQRGKLSRRRVLTGAAGVSAATILHWPANAAEFSYKLGSSSPMEHPAMAAQQDAANKIKQESNGRLEITIYPNSVLGGDTAMIAQTISGAMEMYNLPIDLLAPRNPVCGLPGVGFAFPDYAHVWAAMDGEFGNFLRAAAEEIGLYCLEKGYDHGFRQITTRTKPITSPDDLKGFKIRLPVAPYLISLFRHLGASPTAINFNEVYSALQTGIVDGQENPLVLIDTAKLFEVQKYCSLTNHVWAGFHTSFNVAAWKKLPPDLQEMCHHNFSEVALKERDAFVTMTKSEQQNLSGKGLTFNSPDTKPFRDVLAKTGFYPDMKKTAGDKGWALLEKYVGPLTS
ncbi:MAG TPA: TRAP transporter substrate-binding protein [Acetobacteraceae bacterium]|nr:TRAP transporter substrate-binding protein [Acetobacteraceae bacterium]